MTLLTSAFRPLPPGSPPQVRRRRWLTVLTAMASATAGAGLAGLAGLDLAVRRGDTVAAITGLDVILVSLGVGLLGWLVLELLERRTPRSHAIWRALAGAVLVLSLTGPSGATSSAAVAALIGLHLLVGGILILGLGGSARLGPPAH